MINTIYGTFCLLKLFTVFITHANSSRVGRAISGIHVSVRLSVGLFFHTITQKLMQLGSPNLTQTWSTVSPRNVYILGSKGLGHTTQKNTFILVERRNVILTFAAGFSLHRDRTANTADCRFFCVWSFS